MLIAPDELESDKSYLILMQMSGELNSPECAESIQNILRKLSEVIAMLNAGLVIEGQPAI